MDLGEREDEVLEKEKALLFDGEWDFEGDMDLGEREDEVLSSDFRFMKIDRFISSFLPTSSSEATLSDSLSTAFKSSILFFMIGVGVWSSNSESSRRLSKVRSELGDFLMVIPILAFLISDR